MLRETNIPNDQGPTVLEQYLSEKSLTELFLIATSLQDPADLLSRVASLMAEVDAFPERTA